MARKSSWKLPFPKPPHPGVCSTRFCGRPPGAPAPEMSSGWAGSSTSQPMRWITSKKRVERSATGLVKIWSSTPWSSRSARMPSSYKRPRAKGMREH
eukprot:scaffold83116_cov29-Tisochrysis_lutea.AAC.4